jgi:hypothetical protein
MHRAELAENVQKPTKCTFLIKVSSCCRDFWSLPHLSRLELAKESPVVTVLSKISSTTSSTQIDKH